MKKTLPPQVDVENISPQDAEYLRNHWDNFSYTTKHAKWINNPKEHEDHKGQALATRSHEVIIDWAEQRNAAPATVPGTEHSGHPGVLRFNFPGYEGKDLQEIDWDKWFKAFDDRQLTFLYQEHLKNGRQSNFFKMDSPYREHE